MLPGWKKHRVTLRSHRLLAYCVAALLALAAVFAAPSVAQAASITGLKVTAVTQTSFTVSLDSLGTGWTYSLYASTVKADVYYDSLPTAPYHASSSTPRVTLASLPYSTNVYWWRVQGTRGTSHYTSDILSVGMVPGTPTSVSVGGSAGHGTWVTWSGSAAGYQVQQGWTSAFTTGLHTYTLRGRQNQFTPYGLELGRRYYLRVRASNGTTYSPWSGSVSAVSSSAVQGVKIGTYNVLESRFDGTSEGGNTVAAWADRRVGVAAGIKASGANVVGIQEAADWVGPQCVYRQVGTRQIDDLVSRLGSPWSLATTEVRPCLPGWMRTGVYIIYDHSQFTAVGSGGQWNIGTSTDVHWAVYQQLRSVATGAQFLFVSPHTVAGNSTQLDQNRQVQTTHMIADAKSYAASHGNVPIVYAGDYNSHALHPLDGPAVAMYAAQSADGLTTAQTLTNQGYNSANQYQTTPPGGGWSVDHIYASPGVSIQTWQLIIKLTGGDFVGVIPSDHNMLEADVTFPYPATTPPARTGPIVGLAGRCLDDDHSRTVNGNKIQIYACNGGLAQSWTVGSDGTLRVLGKCLDDDHSGTANGNKIQLYTCNGSAAQKWTASSDGTLRVFGRCLDVTHSGTASGTPVQLFACNGSDAQKWRLP